MRIRVHTIDVDVPGWAKRLFKLGAPVVIVMGIAVGVYAGTVSKPHDFKAGETIVADQVNENFDVLYELVNGNLDDANVSLSGVGSIPTGTIIWWACPSGTACTAGDTPAGFKVCDGSVIAAAGSVWDGQFAPDLIDRFAMGAVLGQNQAQGGANSTDASHSHSVPGHFHGSGSLNVTSTAGGTHGHRVSNTWLFGRATPAAGGDFGGFEGVGSAPFDTVGGDGDHVHTIAATSFAGSVGDTSGANGDVGSASSTSGDATQDRRPAFVGLLPLLKL